VVTGASRGIGYAIAEELARRGYHLALLGRDASGLSQAGEHLRHDYQASAEAFPCDVRRASRVRSSFGRILKGSGRLEVLVNNAGVGYFGPLHEIPDAEWDEQMETNLRGVFYCSKAVIPRMIEQRFGHIINISSLAGKNAFPGGSAYCASKWGLLGLTYCMAEDLRRYNIRVSAICPGSVETEFSPHTGKDPGRMLQPADVARVVGWLVEQREQSFVSEVLIRPTQKP
jgi:3-oxoacyl-[acyl-carrier protein] reductase